MKNNMWICKYGEAFAWLHDAEEYSLYMGYNIAPKSVPLGLKLQQSSIKWNERSVSLLNMADWYGIICEGN